MTDRLEQLALDRYADLAAEVEAAQKAERRLRDEAHRAHSQWERLVSERDVIERYLRLRGIDPDKELAGAREALPVDE